MQPSTLPFGALPFDRIGDSDYQPAIEAGMVEQLKEIAAVVDDPAPPTFANTFVAMERSGRLLARAQGAFSVEVATNSNPQLLRIRQTLAPELAAHADAIYLNPRLFRRVQVIYKQLPRLKLDPESRHLVITYYRRFLHAGAKPCAGQAGAAQTTQPAARDAAGHLRTQAACRNGRRSAACEKQKRP